MCKGCVRTKALDGKRHGRPGQARAGQAGRPGGHLLLAQAVGGLRVEVQEVEDAGEGGGGGVVPGKQHDQHVVADLLPVGQAAAWPGAALVHGRSVQGVRGYGGVAGRPSRRRALPAHCMRPAPRLPSLPSCNAAQR